MAQGHRKKKKRFLSTFFSLLDVMNETIEENKVEPLPPPPPPVSTQIIVEDSIASRTKEITKRPKRERSPS